jgi:hypothetical protein
MDEKMGKKCLIMYSSHTNNTQKVAMRFKTTFEKNGWICDMFKVRRNADDILRPPINLDDYDFLCVGSGIIAHLPYNEIIYVLKRLIYGADPRLVIRSRDQDIPYIKEPVTGELPDINKVHRRIKLSPNAKKAIVFVTYSGLEFGPKEAVPSLDLLALEVEHLEFQCIGTFCCPGKYLNDPLPKTYHGDIRGRPNKRDLLKAQMFIEDVLEDIEK